MDRGAPQLMLTRTRTTRKSWPRGRRWLPPMASTLVGCCPLWPQSRGLVSSALMPCARLWLLIRACSARRGRAGDGKRCYRGVAHAIRHCQSRQWLTVPSLLGLREGVVDALLLGTMRLIAEIHLGALAALTTGTRRVSATIPGVRSACWQALPRCHCPASPPSIVKLQLLARPR